MDNRKVLSYADRTICRAESLAEPGPARCIRRIVPGLHCVARASHIKGNKGSAAGSMAGFYAKIHNYGCTLEIVQVLSGTSPWQFLPRFIK
jgi:hypothetical protein